MTVSKALHCCPTDEIVKGSSALFYPAKIPAPHHQLRHLVSTAEEGRIFYASHYDVYSLELSTSTRSLVATLPFLIQSLVAGHGWVCVGGSDKGHCAFIKIVRDGEPEEADGEERPLPPPRCFGHDLNVEALGGEIVNSMNIHQFSHGPHNETETVVLISNNDKTVKIYSLNQQKVLTTLKHPCPMNYANFSPDSTLLVACGDTDRIFFYKRQVVDEKTAVYGWQNIAAPKVPVNGDENDYSFSVAFSPSGELCAVSSQGGTITIFDLTNLDYYAEERKAEAAILCSFRSTRDSSWGFVRSMAFSPEPYGLLAWAEDYGRVGVADVRQYFIRRQFLKLEKDADEVKKIDVRDTTPAAYSGLTVKELLKKQEAERLMLEQGDEHHSPIPSPPPTEAWAAEARLRQPRRQPFSYHQGLDLDSRERSVLDTLETTMDDIQPHSPQGAHPYSVSYTSSPRMRPSAGPAIPSAWRGDRSYMPRRRTSIVLSPSRNENETHPSTLAPRNLSRNRLTASPSHIPHPSDRPLTPDDLPPLMSTNDLTPQAGGSTSQPLPYDIPPSDPWSTIQSALETARAADNDMATLRRLNDTLDTVENGINTLEHHSYSWQTREPALRTRTSVSAGTSAIQTPPLRGSFDTDGTQLVLNSIRRQEEEQRRLQAEQRHQNARLDTLERQIRRDARATISAASELEAIENAALRGVNGDRYARIVEQRAQARARTAAMASIRAESSSASSASRDETRLNAERYLANRTQDENRMRMLYRARQAMDQNGNWMMPATTTPLQRLSELGVLNQRTESEELRRERGLGSTGVGWSADGLTL
jgi:hypothetical protein